MEFLTDCHIWSLPISFHFFPLSVCLCGRLPVSAMLPSTEELNSHCKNGYEIRLLSENLYKEGRVIIDCVDSHFCGFVPGMHVCTPMKFFLSWCKIWKGIRKKTYDHYSFCLVAVEAHKPLRNFTLFNIRKTCSFSVHICTWQDWIPCVLRTATASGEGQATLI